MYNRTTATKLSATNSNRNPTEYFTYASDQITSILDIDVIMIIHSKQHHLLSMMLYVVNVYIQSE